MLIKQRLISYAIIQEWVESMKNSKLKTTIQEILLGSENDFLSLNKEAKIKMAIGNIISTDERELARRLITSENGLEWDWPTDGCPSKKLILAGLARYDCRHGERLLKATKFLFYPEIQFLIGIASCY